jgi:hypothetical protein
MMKVSTLGRAGFHIKRLAQAEAPGKRVKYPVF